MSNGQEMIRKRWWAQRWLVAAGLLAAAAAGAAADSFFSDVPPGAPFFNAINAIYKARVTTGCAPGQYCPGEPVTREQMAAFMQRGFGRLAFVKTDTELESYDKDIAVLTIKTGGAPGGKGYLKVEGVLDVTTESEVHCPCNVVFQVTDENLGLYSPFSHGQLADATEKHGYPGTVPPSMNATVAAVFEVPTATIVVLRMKAWVTDTYNYGAPPNHATGVLSALYVPLDRFGNDPPIITPLPGAEQETGTAP